MKNLNRAELFVGIATDAIEAGNLPRYFKAMRIAKKYLTKSKVSQ